MIKKKPSEIKRMSDRALARLALDLKDEVLLAQAQLSLAKREQRARRLGRSRSQRAVRSCGRPANELGLERRLDGQTLH